MNLRLLSKYCRTILIVAEMNIRQQMMDGFVVFTVLFQPIIIALLGLWRLKDKGADSAMFVVVGSGLTGLWSSLLFISGGSINAERWSGTLESMVAIPTPFEVVVYGKNLGNVIQSLLSMVSACRFPSPTATPQHRPALVLSDAAAFNIPAGHSVMAMFTSQANAPWPLDWPIADLKAAGLPAPSLVRYKLFTLDHRLVRGELGRLSANDAAAVRIGLAHLLEGTP